MTARWRSLAGLAWRESRTARRRLLLYMSSISLGVAALVAIDSFAVNITQSIAEQSRALVGGDVALSSRQTFTPRMEKLLDSLQRTGSGVARMAEFTSMGFIPRTGATRLVQVRAVSREYPFYGEIETLPVGEWSKLQSGANALVDRGLLIALSAQIGDTLALGHARFRIIGELTVVPGDPGISAAIGPRVYIPSRYLPETQLLGFGSRVRHEALLRIPPKARVATYLNRINPVLDSARVRPRTVSDAEEDLTDAIASLRDFLGIVGLIALLLGGIGVASGVHAFVARKIDTVAVLRCLGATSGQALAIYVTQALIMGILGAMAGAALGVAVQFATPRLVADFLPIQLEASLVPEAILLGLGVGATVALLFALRPLVALRHVSPLQTLRRDTDARALGLDLRDPVRLILTAAITTTVVALAVTRSQSLQAALWTTVAIAIAVAVLGATATLVSWLAKKSLRARWPFVVRQGIANLYRPANQTAAVILALGFGVFLIATLYQVQSSLLRQVGKSAVATRANALFFDVQSDQIDGVLGMLRERGQTVVQSVPIVPMRMAAIDGVPVDTIIKQRKLQRNFWVLRREYRSTYRDTLNSAEKLVRGRWFAPGTRVRDSIGAFSFDAELAKETGLIHVGTVVTWDVQGVMVRARVTSLREIDWARFEPNFFAVFHSSTLRGAPRQYVVMAETTTPTVLAEIQRDLVQRYPNVSSLDLSLVQSTIRGILGRVATAVRFMAMLSLLLGIPVLFSAVAATRRDRIREGVLLKTLGATRSQVRAVMLSEYAVLGVLGTFAGFLLSFGAAWALSKFMFQIPFVPAVGPALAIAAGMVALTVVIGLLAGRDVFKSTPMAALREA